MLLDQQKYLEGLRKDRAKNNVFVAGVPNEMIMNGNSENDHAVILQSALAIAAPDINTTDYRIPKNFEPRTDSPVHSIKISVTDLNVKTKLLQGSRKLKQLTADSPFKKVFLKNDDPPLTRKENDRLYLKVRELRSKEDAQNPENSFIIKSGKLLKNNQPIDEFNLNNVLFC